VTPEDEWMVRMMMSAFMSMFSSGEKQDLYRSNKKQDWITSACQDCFSQNKLRIDQCPCRSFPKKKCMIVKHMFYNVRLLELWKRLTLNEDEKNTYFYEENQDDFYRLVEEYALMWQMIHIRSEFFYSCHVYADWIIPRHGLWSVIEHDTSHASDSADSQASICGLSLPVRLDKTFMFTLNPLGERCQGKIC
jgi:hypothetical protein